VTIFASEASHEEPAHALPLADFAPMKKPPEGGLVFADSAPVSNGSEDKASPGC